MEILKELSLISSTKNAAYFSYNMSDENISTVKIEQATFTDYKQINDEATIDQDLFNIISESAINSDIEWRKTSPLNVSRIEQYQTFGDMLIELSLAIYNQTKRFHGNKFIISAKLVPVINFLNCFILEPMSAISGTYKLGKIDSAFLQADVYVSPYLNDNEVICTVVGKDHMTAALGASVVDDQYSIKVLNKNLIIRGTVID